MGHDADTQRHVRLSVALAPEPCDGSGRRAEPIPGSVGPYQNEGKHDESTGDRTTARNRPTPRVD